MPYIIRWIDKGCIVSFSSSFSLLENVEANSDVFDDPRSATMSFAVWDLSEVSDYKLTAQEISVISYNSLLISKRVKLKKLAIIAAEDRLRDVSKLYAVQCATEDISWEIQVFENMAQADSWIRL